MITRFVGLPWGTAIEAALATTTAPRNSGANGAPKRGERDQQRDHQHDRSVERDRRGEQGAEGAHEHVEGEELPCAPGGERARRALGEPERSTSAANVSAAARNATSGAITATAAPRPRQARQPPRPARPQRGVRASWSRERSDGDGCKNDVSDKHGY